MDTAQIKPELTRRRNIIAATIVVAHAIKHIYLSGTSALIMPEIKIGLGLSRSQFGSLATSNAVAWWASSMAAGYLGDRFSNRVGLMLGISLGLMGGSYALAGSAPN